MCVCASLLSLFDTVHPLDLETLYGGPVVLLGVQEVRGCVSAVGPICCVVTPVDCRGREVQKERVVGLFSRVRVCVLACARVCVAYVWCSHLMTFSVCLFVVRVHVCVPAGLCAGDYDR